MSKLFSIFTALLLSLPTSASDSAVSTAPAPVQQSAQQGLGALARDVQCNLTHPVTGSHITQAVEIIDVQKDGASYQKGLRSGDLLITINGHPVAPCAEIKAQLMETTEQGIIKLELMRGQELIEISGELSAYQANSASATSARALKKAAELFDKEQTTRPVSLNEEHRAKVAEYAGEIKQELSQVPDDTDARAIIRNMQNIRNVFRDSNSQSQGWMKGNAGEATIQFKKGPYVLILKGMNNMLRLEVYNQGGTLIFAGSMDTPEQCQAVPTDILHALQSL